jgi:hypothetical protein
MATNERVGEEKVVSVLGRFEPLHLPVSWSRRSMRVFGPIFQVSTLSALDARKPLTLSNAVAPQLVGHNHPWLIL